MKLSLRVQAIPYFLVLVIFLVHQADAFSPVVQMPAKVSKTTSLNAWTLQNPTNNKYGTFTNTWYDDHNPTFRKVVYNDDDQADTFHYVSFVGEDWPTMDGDEAVKQQEPPKRSLRKAASWAIARMRHLYS